METPPPLPISRSSFVTAIAWVFIALTGFAVSISVLQNIMIYTFFPVDQMQSAMAQARERQEMPAYFWFMAEHIREIFTGFLVVTSGVLVASIGLLKRWNWARVLFIWFLGLGIVWNLAGLAWPWFFFRTMPQPPQNAPMHAQFQAMAIVMGIFSDVFALGTVILFVWIIKRLSSATIKSEFTTRAA